MKQSYQRLWRSKKLNCLPVLLGADCVSGESPFTKDILNTPRPYFMYCLHNVFYMYNHLLFKNNSKPLA